MHFRVSVGFVDGVGSSSFFGSAHAALSDVEHAQAHDAVFIRVEYYPLPDFDTGVVIQMDQLEQFARIEHFAAQEVL